MVDGVTSTGYYPPAAKKNCCGVSSSTAFLIHMIATGLFSLSCIAVLALVNHITPIKDSITIPLLIFIMLFTVVSTGMAKNCYNESENDSEVEFSPLV